MKKNLIALFVLAFLPFCLMAQDVKKEKIGTGRKNQTKGKN